MCCTRLAGNAGRKKSPKICHLGTIAQICPAISSHLRRIVILFFALYKYSYLLTYLHIDNRKKLIKQQISPPHAPTIWWTNGWDLLASLGQTGFAPWLRYCSDVAIFGWAAITLGIAPHSTCSSKHAVQPILCSPWCSLYTHRWEIMQSIIIEVDTSVWNYTESLQ